MKTKDYDFELDDVRISVYPGKDKSKLLVVDRKRNTYQKKEFSNLLNFLNEGDCLVLNNTFVYPARLYGELKSKKKRFEFLLIRELRDGLSWEVLIKNSKKCVLGDEFKFKDAVIGKLTCKLGGGLNHIRFNEKLSYELLDEIGQMALPSYILKLRDYRIEDKKYYQPSYTKKLIDKDLIGKAKERKRVNGSIASPTAGLHFTKELLEKLKKGGIEIAYITLHVSVGTFKPIMSEDIEGHKMGSEEYVLEEEEAQKINKAVNGRKRVIAVGTTTTRVLEHCSIGEGLVKASFGSTNLFIYPGYKFRVIKGLISNFHMGKSTPLLLVCAFGGKKLIEESYKYAHTNDFGFYSYGDGMLII